MLGNGKHLCALVLWNLMEKNSRNDMGGSVDVGITATELAFFSIMVLHETVYPTYTSHGYQSCQSLF